jgi:N-acetylneuraminate synthase/N,N'-diacetyllegionaminate synthase
MKKSLWAGKNGPLLIAEIGGNHEGNFTYAKKLVKLAIDSGVDVVKLQLYSGDMLVSPIESKERFKHFRKFELTKKQHIYLANLCRSSGVKYLASVWDLKMLDWIDRYLNFYKIGSGDLTALPVIKEFVKRGKPIILSTGLSNLSEIKNTIKFIQKENKVYKSKNKLAILQCTSSYPTIDEEVNLAVIETLKKSTNLTIGYSHHNTGSLALLAAYTLGAEILEFHFTDKI